MKDIIHMCRCGHGKSAHYNTRGEGSLPCHHLGKHDTRCACRDFVEVFVGTLADWEQVKTAKCSHCNRVTFDVREYEGGCGEPVCKRCDAAMRTPWDAQ